jgi:hypothetical protein
MIESDHLIYILHQNSININKINNLLEKLIVEIISWAVENLLPSAELADNRLMLNVDV